MVVEILEANKHISNPGPRLVAWWLPSPENCYKVNFDAAMFDHLGCAGIRVVVRDHKREVMAALSQKIALPQSVALEKLGQPIEQSLLLRKCLSFAFRLKGIVWGLFVLCNPKDSAKPCMDT